MILQWSVTIAGGITAWAGAPEATNLGKAVSWFKNPMTERLATAAFPFTLFVLAAGRPPPRSVARIRQAALADRLALRRVGDGMVMVAFGYLIRVSPPRFDRLTRRL